MRRRIHGAFPPRTPPVAKSRKESCAAGFATPLKSRIHINFNEIYQNHFSKRI